jgi:hypothetical protein
MPGTDPADAPKFIEKPRPQRQTLGRFGFVESACDGKKFLDLRLRLLGGNSRFLYREIAPRLLDLRRQRRQLGLRHRQLLPVSALVPLQAFKDALCLRKPGCGCIVSSDLRMTHFVVRLQFHQPG